MVFFFCLFQWHAQTINFQYTLYRMFKKIDCSISVVFQRAEADPNVKVVLLEGEGEKAFCAGGDIRGIEKLT